jgi:alpha-L-arabinofuranosidase
MVISMEETATVMLDCVSLFPRCPEVVLPTTVDGAEIGSNRTGDTNQVQVRRIYALAGLDQKRHEVVIKVMNPAAKDVSASISLKGATKLGNSATASTLAHSNPAAKNSLDKPGVVVPKESSFKPAGAQFTYDFAPNSFTILRLPLANN